MRGSLYELGEHREEKIIVETDNFECTIALYDELSIEKSLEGFEVKCYSSRLRSKDERTRKAYKIRTEDK